MRLTYLGLLLGLILLVSSCATTSPATRGSLKEAVRKNRTETSDSLKTVARDSDEAEIESDEALSVAWEFFKYLFFAAHEEVEESDVQVNSGLTEDVTGGPVGNAGSPFVAAPPFSKIARRQRGFRVSYARGVFTGNDLRDPMLFSGGFVSNIVYPLQIDLFFNFTQTSLKRGSEYGRSIEEYQQLIDIGLAGRYYLPAGNAKPNFYLLLGGGFNLLMWSYREPLIVNDPDGLVSIEQDNVSGFTSFIGMGYTPLYSRHFQMAFELQLGTRSYGKTTAENFRNDIFDTNYFFLWGIQFQLYY